MNRAIEAGRAAHQGPGRTTERAKRPEVWAGPVGRAGTRRFRTALVDRIRREIAAGTYETSARLDGAVDALMAHLRGRGA